MDRIPSQGGLVVNSKPIFFALLSIGLTLVGACGFDAAPAAEAVFADTGTTALLTASGPEYERIRGEEVAWILESKPADSTAFVTGQALRQAELYVDRRGVYVVDRWIYTELSDNWTHRYFIDVDDPAPIAHILWEPQGQVGVPVTMDGASSTGTSLTFQWQLTNSPQDSSAELASSTAPVTGFLGDVPGSYEVTLDVFDGNRWDETPARAVIRID